MSRRQGQLGTARDGAGVRVRGEGRGDVMWAGVHLPWLEKGEAERVLVLGIRVAGTGMARAFDEAMRLSNRSAALKTHRGWDLNLVCIASQRSGA